jgi:hypothetical protein
VSDPVLKSGLLTPVRECVPMRRYLLLRALILLFLFGLIGSMAAARANIQNPSATSFGPGPQFAIADFDGDVRPDLASIQAGSSTSGTTDYWIELHLTAGGRQSIRLCAPAGGLRIEARDVNGDNSIDLVLATAWFNQPVAILINNGHGSFSRVEPTAFPGAFSEATTSWASVSEQAIDVVGAPPQSRAGICSEERGLLHVRSPARLIAPSRSRLLVSPFLILTQGAHLLPKLLTSNRSAH